jgi:chorismate synthase
VVRLGPVATRSRAVPTLADLEEIDASPVRCLDGEAEGRMAAAVDAAKAAGDTLGGVFEVVAHGLPPGLGSYVHWDRKLDARLAGALMSIQAGVRAKAVVQRSDVTAVPAAGVVGEAVVALVLADALLEKTGGDSLAEVRRNLDAYLTGLDPHDDTGSAG